MGKINSSTDANQHLDLVRQTIRVESTPIDVTVTNPPIFLNMADRKDLLDRAIQIVGGTHIAGDFENRLNAVEQTYDRLMTIVKGAK